MVINDTKCDIVHLETLVNIGNIRNLEINTLKLISICLHAEDLIYLGIIKRIAIHLKMERNKFL